MYHRFNFSKVQWPSSNWSWLRSHAGSHRSHECRRHLDSIGFLITSAWKHQMGAVKCLTALVVLLFQGSWVQIQTTIWWLMTIYSGSDALFWHQKIDVCRHICRQSTHINKQTLKKQRKHQTNLNYGTSYKILNQYSPPQKNFFLKIMKN